jgi:uncharacterized protein (TIGR02270 family)
VIQEIVDQYSQEAAFLWLLREAGVRAPHYNLEDLSRLDDRIEANIDGLRVAGEAGWELCIEQLQHEEAGEVLAAAVLALESRDQARIDLVIDTAARVPEAARGLLSALGWVEKEHLHGTVKAFLDSDDPFRHRLGLTACALHRVDPGARLDAALSDPDPLLRARALKAAGELGRADLRETLQERLEDSEEACRFWAAWSAVLVGARGRALRLLQTTALVPSSWQFRAIGLAGRGLDPAAAHPWLKALAGDPALGRALITAVGLVGDPHYVPWLIGQMETPERARIAGEAFSMITGVDLAYEDLEGEWPEGFEAGPTENPEDEDVAMDPDEDLPWPAPDLIARWWAANGGRFPAGRRFLCGQPISEAHCQEVLRSGYQRQRIAAALELALMRPDRPLFEWRAPGYRQQRLLPPAAAPKPG